MVSMDHGGILTKKRWGITDLDNITGNSNNIMDIIYSKS